MNRSIRFFSLFSVSVILSLGLNGQQLNTQSAGDTASYPYWIQMMQDPGASFHATQSAFEKYWNGRTDYKGNGWKIFKRWEYINESRVQPDGKLRPPDYLLNENKKYQETHQSRSLNGNWSLIGPISLPSNATSQPNGLGRVNCLAFHPTNANIFYAGSPSGGIWKTADGGTTWSVLISNLPSIGVSAILLHPTDENLILIGTGDRDAGDAPGIGVYKSTDGGSTWNSSNSGMGNKTVGMLVRHPSNVNIILAATSGGIYKSTDGGSNWTLKSSNSNNYKDIRFKPGDPAIVYATEGGKFYRSTNTGDSWSQVTSGVISGNRLVIGVSPNQPDWVYLLQTNGPFAGLLKSTNSGQGFSTQSTSPNIMDYSCTGSGGSSQAWYDLCIAVDPANANILYTGGINIWKSLNGGVTWTINSHWVGALWGENCAPSVHADIHTLDWSPVNARLYTGNDGGVYYTSNGGVDWNDVSSGLAIAQVYKIGQSATVQGLTINGYQDNGTATNSGTSFTTVIGGDGMECIVDHTNPAVRYGELYYGYIYRTTGSYYYQVAGNGSNGINESGGWVTPYILHETNPATMFIGYKNVWRSTNVNAASPSSVSWTKITSGWTSNCTVLEQSPANVDILYVVSSGSLKRTENANAGSPTWTACTLPGGATPSDLETHPTDPNIIYATANYSVYKSTDKGVSWTSISGTLPNVYLNTVVYDKNTTEGLYVGNETGIFYKDASMSDWSAFNTGLPTVDVRELEIFYDTSNPGNNRLKAATYGRGLWESDLFSFFTVNPLNQDVAYTAGTTNFYITAPSSLSWTASSNESWCTVPSGGTGSDTLTASYSENPLITSRIAIITLTPAGLSSQNVTVTQAGGPATLQVVPGNQDVEPPAGITTFEVTSNTDWTVTSDASWCTVTSSGTGNDTIFATYEENTSLNSRIANITVTVNTLAPQTVTVTQAGVMPILNITPLNQDVTEDAGSTSFTVTSNTDWIAVSDMTWCTVTGSGSGNGTIVADYTGNTEYNQRIANITVTVSDIPPQVVTVTQDASTVSTGDLSGEEIRIFPNPAKDKFEISSGSSGGRELHVTILDYTGKVILTRNCTSGKTCSFDLSDTPNGCYFIKIKSEKTLLIRKLIIL